jgi:hypothetical protein
MPKSGLVRLRVEAITDNHPRRQSIEKSIIAAIFLGDVMGSPSRLSLM